MKKVLERSLWAAWVLGQLLQSANADSTFVYAVQLSAVVQVSPPQITISWEADPYGANSYTVYRKAKEASSWGPPVATLAGETLHYADTDVTRGGAYEYQVVKAAALGYTGYGYIYAGIEAPLIEGRGTLVLIVGTESVSGLDTELTRLEQDLAGDGWQVVRHDVSTNDSPQAVRDMIIQDYHLDPTNVDAVFLFGHVPILQSGYLDYDGHGPRPMAADAYYAEMNDDWPPYPTNSPSYLPSDAALMVGRVDLANMPGVAAPVPWPSERELLRNYLNKDHAWRHGLLPVPRRALMGNRRGDENGLATAATGYRNFEPLVGPRQTVEANIADTAPTAERWVSMLGAGAYLWAYGCGAGQDTAIGYLGTNGVDAEVWSRDIVGQDAKAVFVMVFGSHFGNWDHSDDIMRSVLATPTMGLTCCMAGKPHWFCHHMALGEPIGYSTRLSLNNAYLYQSQTNPFTRAVYISLMGDPTLRMEPVAPPQDLAATADLSGVHLHWAVSPVAVAGYHVYRAVANTQRFQRLTQELISATNYVDFTAAPNSYTYMVRAVELQTNASGSYFDPSQGVFVDVTVTAPAAPIVLQPLVTDTGLTLSWNTQAGLSYHVYGSTDPVRVNWVDLSGLLLATNSTLRWSDTAVFGQQLRFYRVASP